MKILKGISASSGVIEGVARVISSKKDFSQFKPGDILMTKSTNPIWTPLIAIAGGVITGLGGSLSHAAIVSREYGIPAIVGTQEATKLIKSGQRVKIDGRKGLVEY